MSKLENEIQQIKNKLTTKAKRKGLWENFGQKEIRNLEDKHDYLGLCYGSPDERIEGDKILGLREWCEEFDLSNLK